MKEKAMVSRSKHKCFPTEEEEFVAQILVDLTNMILRRESGSVLKWGCRKRRSRFNGNVVALPKAAPEDGGAAATSPVTPLAFPPSESDDKSRHPLKRSSKKRPRDNYVDLLAELSQRRDSLKEEIGNVTRYYNKLIAYNSKLKAIKQEVINSCQMKEKSKVELIQKHEEIKLEECQPPVSDQMAEKFQYSIGPRAAQFQNGLGPVNHVGPSGFQLPDLNISAEDTFGFGVDLTSQPLDMSGEWNDRRARFAEARRRRMDIIKIKFMRNASCGIKLPRLKS